MKYFYVILLCIFLNSCSDNELISNSDVNSEKITKLLIVDEDKENGVYHFHQKRDFSFVYNQDKLVSVVDAGGNYTENIGYTNGNVNPTYIHISGMSFTGSDYEFPINLTRNLYYDSSNRLVKSENPVLDIYGQIWGTEFEYPSTNIIIAKNYLITSSGNQILKSQSKIYFVNENVEKIEFYNDYSTTPNSNIKFEYDNKINPNSKININRILALPNYSYTVNILQNYSQLSKNNVIKSTNNNIYGSTEMIVSSTDIYYTYDSNTNLPITQSYSVMDNTATNGFTITGNFSY